MRGVGGEPDIARIGQRHQGAGFVLILDQAADMGMRARACGMVVVATPHAEGRRADGAAEEPGSRRATRTLRARWDLDNAGDPFLNPNVPAPGRRATRGVSFRRGARAR